MDGRAYVVALTLLLPTVLIGITVAWYSTNPLSMLILLSVMLVGTLYLLTYSESFDAVSA